MAALFAPPPSPPPARLLSTLCLSLKALGFSLEKSGKVVSRARAIILPSKNSAFEQSSARESEIERRQAGTGSTGGG